MRKFLFVLFLILGGASLSSASEPPIKNAGFVPSNIWYSKDPFFAGDKVRVYTIIFNGSTYDLTGSVEFLDNDVVIGKTNFALSGGGRVQDEWIDWKASQGTHTITARIANATASLAGGAKRTILLDNADAGKSTRIIDLDTDGDGIGNAEDPDDDNDGVSDVDELRNGTDPLKKDTNGNGISDGKELEIAAKKKAEASALLASTTEPTGTISSTIKKVEDAIPSPVKTGVASGINALERFRVGEGYQVRLAKESKALEIEGMKTRIPVASKDGGVLGTVSNTAEKPFAYVILGILTLIQYFLEWQVIFYSVFIYAVYRFARWAIGRIRNR